MLDGESRRANVTLPKHLELLLDGTPLAIERIKHAWPGLPTIDRAYLIAILLGTSEESKAIRWPHHQKQLVDLALADDNAYIRYLAAKNVQAPSRPMDDEQTPSYLEDKARFEKIEADPVILVRSAQMREALDDAEAFWMRPQTERLALVSGVKESGVEIAELLRYATKNLLPIKAATHDEIFDVLLQYLGGEAIAERVADCLWDGYAAYSAGKSVNALWEVIPDIPKALSYVLIECLPEQAGTNSGIPAQVIDSLDELQLKLLLWRNDITLENLRRRLYKESTIDNIRRAAISHRPFRLLDSDISELTYEPQEPAESGKKKVSELAMLAESCEGASLVQMQAICDFLRDAPKDFSSVSGTREAIDTGERLQTRRAKWLSPYTLQREIFAMRLYALAKQLAPLDSSKVPRVLPKETWQDRDIVVPRNPWQTYRNIAEIVHYDVWEYAWKEKIVDLPRVSISDFDLPNELPGDFDDESLELRIKKLAKTVNELLCLAGAILVSVVFVLFK
jgi:hypothetical protein